MVRIQIGRPEGQVCGITCDADSSNSPVDGSKSNWPFTVCNQAQALSDPHGGSCNSGQQARGAQRVTLATVIKATFSIILQYFQMSHLHDTLAMKPQEHPSQPPADISCTPAWPCHRLRNQICRFQWLYRGTQHGIKVSRHQTSFSQIT